MDCPECRLKVQFPKGSIKFLPTNYMLLEMLERNNFKNKVLDSKAQDALLKEVFN
jgi:hypothetical protein